MIRLRSISLVAVLCATALVVAGCGGGNDKSATVQSGAAAKAALLTAMHNAAAQKTGKLELTAKFGATGGSATASLGNVTVSGSGTFDATDPKNRKLDLLLNVALASQTQQLELIVVDNKAYVKIAGQTVELGSANNKTITELTDSLGPQALGRLNKQFQTTVSDVRTTGNETVEGRKLTVYTAKIDFGKVLAAFAGSQGGSLLSSLTGTQSDQTRKGFTAKTVEFGVDENGDVLRHIHVVAAFANPAGGSNEKGTFDLDLKILPPSGPVNITAPANAIKAGGGALGGLLNSFGGGQ